MSEIVQKGYFLDLSQIEPQFRPEKEFTFFFVLRQNFSEIEDLTLSVAANGTGAFDFGSGNLKDLLKPEKKMLFQCAYGIYPKIKTYLEHPVDYTTDKIPKELPHENWRVGIITQTDSSYHDPSFEKAEFWTFYDICTPKIHVNNIYGTNITAHLRILINILVVEPVKEKEVIEQLRKRIKPSTPVTLKPF